jgi:hypothetical protein
MRHIHLSEPYAYTLVGEPYAHAVRCSRCLHGALISSSYTLRVSVVTARGAQ